MPGIPGVEERELICETHYRGTRAIDPWVSTSNGVDFQHLRTLHGLSVVDPDAVAVGPHSLEYRIESPHFIQHGRITGVNAFSQHLAMGTSTCSCSSAARHRARAHRGFYAYGVRDTGQGREARRSGSPSWAPSYAQLIAEDAPVLDTIRFRPRVLVASDRHLARFFKYVREFPRALPPDA